LSSCSLVCRTCCSRAASAAWPARFATACLPFINRPNSALNDSLLLPSAPLLLPAVPSPDPAPSLFPALAPAPGPALWAAVVGSSRTAQKGAPYALASSTRTAGKLASTTNRCSTSEHATPGKPPKPPPTPLPPPLDEAPNPPPRGPAK